MLRRSLLYLSRSRQLRHWMEQSGTAQKFTARFVAGRTIEQGLAVVSRLASEQILATLDFLGENVTTLADAEVCREVYLRALSDVQPYRGTVSLKLTQFGLDFSPSDCLHNIRPLVACARAEGSRVEVDMESSEYTDRTLAIVQQLREEFGDHVRVAIQAYLHRSEADIARLSELQIPVRLCKGAYKEPASLAWPGKDRVDENYRKLACQLLDHGAYPAIASHDEAMLRACLEHVREQKIAADRFEFQMLYGIRRDLQRELVKDGYRLRLYVPYGEAWYPYFMRRLAERPANLLFLMRNLLR